MMINVQIRKQGGAAIVTIPSDLLKILKLSIGDTLALDVANDELIAHPVRKVVRKRYSVAALLQGTTKKSMKALNEETEWAREGKSVGREKP